MKKLLLHIEKLFNSTFTERYNPLYHLGAIAVFLLWPLFISGIYLFIFYRIGAPYESVKTITESHWHIGNLMRALHRYSADGLVAITVLHLVRELIKGRFRHWRWMPWVTGVVVLAVIWVSGIIGYWMVWDERAQMVAEISSKLLDFLPIFGQSLSMAFTTAELVTNMFFLIALFLHLTLPVLVIILVLVHVVRVTKPAIHPPRLTAYAVSLALIALALIRPMTTLAPADTERIASVVGIDIFYMALYPALNVYPAWLSWVLIACGATLLASIPWLFPKKRPPAAAVISENCVGCGQCREDCPYAAVIMRPRPDKEPEAVVIAERCASCGICVGSCSFAAVSFPLNNEKDVIEEIRALLKDNVGSALAFVCANAQDAEKTLRQTAEGHGLEIKIVKLPCTGMVHPNWAELALREGASKVFIRGCSPGDCHYRVGNIWLTERLSGARRPQLKSAVDREQIFLCLSTSPGHDAAPCPAEPLSAAKNNGGCKERE